MAICLYSKHMDAVTVHDSMVEFVHDYQDCIDNVGLEVWFEDDAVVIALIDGHDGYIRFADLP